MLPPPLPVVGHLPGIATVAAQQGLWEQGLQYGQQAADTPATLPYESFRPGPFVGVSGLRESRGCPSSLGTATRALRATISQASLRDMFEGM